MQSDSLWKLWKMDRQQAPRVLIACGPRAGTNANRVNRTVPYASAEETPSESRVGEASARYHHLDAVRAFALLLGVFFHAAESFGPGNTYWAIVDCSPSDLLEWLRFGCHSFRLELFFVIAGFFARLVLERRGTRAFVTNRFQRILVPLVIGWAVLFPICIYIWLWGWSISGQLANVV